MDEINARAVLRVSARASQVEIDAAYRDRIGEVRKQFNHARGTREKCKRERNAIEEARRTLLHELEDQEQRQREEEERLAAEQRQREENERLAAEQLKGQEKERLAAGQGQRQENERTAAQQPQRVEKKRLNATLLAGGALALILAGVFAGVWFWSDWQNKQKPGKLDLNTLPPYAEVFVDGVSRGKTPLVLDDIAPGERHLRIELGPGLSGVSRLFMTFL